MNCINVIPVVKVGLEVEFLSGSGRFVLSFSRKLEPHRDYREERAEIKGAEKRRGTGMKKGGRAVYEQREFGHCYRENAELFDCCRDVAYNFTNIQHYDTREIER